MKQLSAFFVGLVFGLGLIIAGMSNPAKVLAFLDLFGLWDPSLAFVMIGGIGIALIGFTLAKTRQRSVLGDPIGIPTKKQLDKRLIIGSLFFGIGWGLAGICPGPALVLLGSGETAGVIFIGSMLVGMLVFELLERKRTAS